ncbi:putative protocadherin Fat 1 [Apostichopus japonicus]|uniref:Putative protocadherin Fat 1 n=1 Tax=Stichopus japonicus TaxID=307972 RepID=A0A2G8JMW6_STIJA|nr:putative protocadherin Fat 1 [Apostichopus japonicus]
MSKFRQEMSQAERESKARYTVAISAEGIQDINDALPVFHSLRHQVTIPEDLPVGSSIAHIQAVDADVGSNGEIYYSLKRDTNDFAIHPSSGEVTLTRPLTEIEQSTLTLEVVAKDRGQMVYGDSPISESPTSSLRITVIPVNKYEPKIVVTKLPKLTRKDKVFAEVFVTDADEGQNGEIQSLELEEDDFSSFFQVQSLNSEGRYQVMVLQNNPLLPTMFNLTLIARDNGSPMKMSYHVLTANLDKTMSYSSLFVSSSVNVSISELTPINTPIINIAPHDAPTDALEYSVMEAEVPFAVVDGVLIVADDLDRGLKHSYNISVKSFDQQDMYLGMCHVSIFLIDENNHSPVFDQESYQVDFDENQDAGTVVTVVIASDEDEGENGYVFYSIANLNQVPFKIDYMTGVITSTELLDFETMRSRYTLLVRASDWGAPYQRESQVTVSINLAPVNDNPPQFEKVNCTGTISKSHPAGLSIALLPAVDFDSSTREIVFSEGNVNDLFYVDPSTGNLTLKRRIADNDPRFYQLKIMVTDGPGSFNFMTTNITIVGNRRNPSNGTSCADLRTSCNSLLLWQSKEKRATRRTINFLETTRIFSIAIQMHPSSTWTSPSRSLSPKIRQWAVLSLRYSPGILTKVTTAWSYFRYSMETSRHDDDIGENGEVQYYLEGNPEAFQVGISSGDVRVAANLDREANEIIELTLVAQDMSAEEPLSTKTSLTIHLMDVNDNAPSCILPLQKFKVREDLPLRASLFQVKAVDPDAGRNSSIHYSFTSGDEGKFEIDPDYGIVRLVAALDFEDTPVYNMTVELQDGGVPHLSSTCDLVVEVIDVNENLHPPVFPDFVITASVEENAEVGREVIAVTATDMDEGRDGELSYFIRGGSGLGMFMVDKFGKLLLHHSSQS